METKNKKKMDITNGYNQSVGTVQCRYCLAEIGFLGSHHQCAGKTHHENKMKVKKERIRLINKKFAKPKDTFGEKTKLEKKQNEF